MNKDFLEGASSFKVRVDNDGNYKVRSLIKKKLGHRVSEGQESTIKHFTISHVWGKAQNPLFFTSLWNVVLIPTHFNYLMDKDDNIHPIVEKVKNTIKQICIDLYDPYNALVNDIPEIKQFSSEFKVSTNNPITDYKIKQLYKKGYKKRETTISDKERDTIEEQLRKMSKRFFIEYFKHGIEQDDLLKVIPRGSFTDNSYSSRLSAFRKIFKEGLEIKALTLIIEKDNTKLDNETIETAKELREEYI